MIYRLPCRVALSVRKSLRAVRIAEQNRYTENTPPRDPIGDGEGKKTAFLLVTKERVNYQKIPAEDSKENENDFYFGYK